MGETNQVSSSIISVVRFISAEKKEDNNNENDNNNDTSRILKRVLTKHFLKKQQSESEYSTIKDNTDFDDSDNDDDDEEDNENDLILSISNKYFTAQVQFVDTILNHHYHPSSNQIEDGIILTFRDSKTDLRKESFDRLDSIHTFLTTSQQQQQCGDKLRLCIGILDTFNDNICSNTHCNNINNNSKTSSSSSSLLYEEEYQRRILWCLDHGYEYIEGVDLSKQGRKKGHLDREKEGYARIVEAFNATIWSSSSTTTTTTTTTRVLSTQASSTAAVNSSTIYENKVTIGMKDEIHPTIENSSDTTTTTTTTTHQKNNYKNNDEDETKLQDLDRVMRDVIRVRNEHRSGAVFTDEERRKRAGDAAMSLMGLFHQMGLDKDDDNEEDDDSDC